MILCVAEVLKTGQLADIGASLDGATFADGAATAGWHARTVKRNTQAARGDAVDRAARLVTEALNAEPVFRQGVLPRRIRPVLFSRYEPNMAYGPHVDDAIMGGAEAQRSDVSVTVFLSSPGDYDGGELVIEDSGGEQAYKLDAGSAIFYPSTSLHRVEPVTRGRREVAVTWVESLIRDAAKREILFDLDVARREMFERDGKSAAFDLISKSHANLLRMWAET